MTSWTTVAVLLAAPVLMQASTTQSAVTAPDLSNKVRHELVMLPYYGVFDNLNFSVDNGVVTLSGQVTRPTLKSSAENVVKNVEGVNSVVNNIEVLPLSPYDDHIRLAVLRSVYGFSPFLRYGMNPQAPIRIIVKNGVVTLEGVVNSQADKDMAGVRASSVSGVFQVHNDLRVVTS